MAESLNLYSMVNVIVYATFYFHQFLISLHVDVQSYCLNLSYYYCYCCYCLNYLKNLRNCWNWSCYLNDALCLFMSNKNWQKLEKSHLSCSARAIKSFKYLNLLFLVIFLKFKNFKGRNLKEEKKDKQTLFHLIFYLFDDICRSFSSLFVSF